MTQLPPGAGQQGQPVPPVNAKGCAICGKPYLQSVGSNHQHVATMAEQANGPWGVYLWGADGWGDAMLKPGILICSECMAKLRRMVIGWNDEKKALDIPKQ